MNPSFLPSLYDKNDNFRALYPPRVAEFAEAGGKTGMTSSQQDAQTGRTVAAVYVDMQVDFCRHDGNLSVPNAENDTQRAVEWTYQNAEHITSIFASLDTHNIFQIFFPSWWIYADTGEHPSPYTMIALNDRKEACDDMGRIVLPLFAIQWSMSYLGALKATGKKVLMLWPYHTIAGTVGATLMPSLAEAFAFYASARLSQIAYVEKGTSPFTENYGIWAAEVPFPGDPSTNLNTTILDMVSDHDLIYILGEAKSHCVLETMKQTVSYFSQIGQDKIIGKLRFVMDAMSSVQHPAVDFDGIANAEIAQLVRQGAVLVKTTDPIG